MITKDLEDADRLTKRRAVEKFSTFWKLATLKKSSDSYIPFQPDSERQSAKGEVKSVVTLKF